MSDRVLVAVLTLCVPVLAPPMAVAGQATTPTRESWSAPQTSWGHPDLRGTWSNTTRTPLQRPADLEGKEFLTEEEWAERAVPEVDNMFVSPSMPTGGYNQDVWLEKGELSRRTSLIVDPPDGRLPPVTPAEQKSLSERTDSYTDARDSTTRIDSWEDLNTYDRCLTRGLPGMMLPAFYNHNYQILQTSDYVAIVVEMIHDARIIPLDGRSHLSPIMRQWLGDSRGHWEGDTLVIDTTNFTEKVYGRGAGGTVFGGDAHHVVERFTRVDADTIDYRVTVTNPAVWTAPWTAAAPMSAMDETLFEYACHEGNRSVPLILSGNRAQEALEAR